MTHSYFGGQPHRRGIGGLQYAAEKAPLMLAAFSLCMAFLSYSLIKQIYSRPAAKVSTVVIERGADHGAMVQVVMPLREIPAGTPLDPQYFTVQLRPSETLPKGAVRSFEELRGQFARAMMVPDQPVVRDYLTAVRPSNGVIESIPAGFRAVTIRVDSRTSVEGWTQAGARVDVVWTSRINGREGIAVIVENAKVLSAERSTEGAEINPAVPIPTTVTLLVNVEDAKRLQLASISGTLSLSLRGSGDVKSRSGNPITVDDLIRVGQRPGTHEPKAMVRMKNPDGSMSDFTLKEGELVKK